MVAIMHKLHVVLVSTRPGRAGEAVAQWFMGQATKHGRFDVELVDLKAWNLPLLDEPAHPRLQQYQHEHTKKWSAKVKEAAAHVFVTPEYNHSAPASLFNALDYLLHEWAYKPAGFVSYGGPTGGRHGVQMAKAKVTALKMMPMFEGVSVPFFAQHLKDGVFTPPDMHEKMGAMMLDEMLRWTDALAPLRAAGPPPAGPPGGPPGGPAGGPPGGPPR